ncbi:phasin family protein [Acidisoma cladoniae]|uniref:phasin family protein n=1 Tax=Acidisoma cladoniae TaxID=3040935 RepID=UPI00254D7569|nr:TIGR01841 family phasin [Acidisoma sp. PAMC 29798]
MSDVSKDAAAHMFGDAMKTASDMTTKYFASFKPPALPEMSALMEMQKRNLSALAAANKLVFEGAQAIAQRQVELMRRQVSDVSEAVKTLNSSVDAKDRTAKQAELIKLAYAKSVADLKEVEDLMRKSSAEALELVHRRFVEAMDEVKTVVVKPIGE